LAKTVPEKRNLIIKKTHLGECVLGVLIFFFLLGKYIASLQALAMTHFQVYFDIKLILNNASYLLLVWSLYRFRLTKFNARSLFLFTMFSAFYQTEEYFSITYFSSFFIAIYLMELYRKNRGFVLQLFFLSGVVYLAVFSFIAIGALGFSNLLGNGIWGRNYISSVLVVFVVAALARSSLPNNSFGGLGLFWLLVLKSRTALVSLFAYAVMNYWRKPWFYMVVFLILMAVEMTVGFSSIIYKWGEGTSIVGGRTEPWAYYISYIFTNFPQTLFPYVFTEASNTMPVYHYFSGNTGAYHAPHNIFIDIIYRMGLIFGILMIFVIILPVFLSSKFKLERNIYISLLIYGFFEPVVSFTTNLISFLFYVILFYLYYHVSLVGRDIEKNISSDD